MPYKDENVKKAYHKQGSRKYYENNTEKVRAAIKKVNKANKEKWQEFKATLKCSVCGENHPAVLDFHHIDPKEKTYSVSRLVSDRSYSKAMEEIKKCIVLCANHHRIHHWDELKNKEKNPAL
jgi:predicted class III extradiol MEMO1 family dioxygenase